ncbi:hypothetical protein TNCV_4828391 [Trichonephila clavipes]|uniref:Uncharacterized protein n=1 Tax=Trichonephila clavipes TaxID=2585209 RepID=A0A8X6SJP5_TRICX|nr:hypothetical protein TNCV_4828391 [Trichonephila clavipes]
MRVNSLTRNDPIRERPLSSLPSTLNLRKKETFPNDWPNQSKASFYQHDNENCRSTSISKYGIEGRKRPICPVTAQ